MRVAMFSSPNYCFSWTTTLYRIISLCNLSNVVRFDFNSLQDRYLPFHNIEKIMKKTPTLPPKAKISKESVKMMQEVISEFISFLTSEAHEQCTENNRKTINAHELLWAMSKLGFERYVGPLKEYMDKYNNG